MRSHGLAPELDGSDHQEPPAASAAGSPVPRADPLNRALLDSRERWRDLALIGNDIIFEADVLGRISFICPADALGYEAGSLHGVAGASLLAEAPGAERFNPFLPAQSELRRRAWLRDAEGEERCYAISVRKLAGPDGEVEGARGVAQDVTAQDAQDAAVAAALRRGELLEHITRRLREEISPPHMMQTVLDAVMNALGCGGVVLVNALPRVPAQALLHAVGTTPLAVLECLADPAVFAGAAPRVTRSPQGHAILLCPAFTRRGEQIVLGLWRERHGRSWDGEDSRLASSIAVVVGVVFARETIERELELSAYSDQLTGLLNRRGFVEELERRINRSEYEGEPNVLIYVDLDKFRWVNDAWGHTAGDDCLRRFAALLRSIFRPTDLVARLGGDEFAVWMDGSDQFTAAERAVQLCREAKLYFRDLADGSEPCLGASVGLAYRAPSNGEGANSMMRRAAMALCQVKRDTPGGWLVSREAATP